MVLFDLSTKFAATLGGNEPISSVATAAAYMGLALSAYLGYKAGEPFGAGMAILTALGAVALYNLVGTFIMDVFSKAPDFGAFAGIVSGIVASYYAVNML